MLRRCSCLAPGLGSGAALLLSLFLVGCFHQPHPKYEGRSCKATGECPSGFACGSDGLCHAGDGGSVVLDASGDRAVISDGIRDSADASDGRLGIWDSGDSDLPPDGDNPVSPDAPSTEPDADTIDAPADGAGGSAGGGSGTSPDAGDAAKSDSADAGGRGGTGGLSTGGAGGTVSSGGGTNAQGGSHSGSSIGGTTASGGGLAGGTSAAGGTTTPPDAAVSGGISTGGASTGGSTASLPHLVPSPPSIDLGDAPLGESSAEGVFTLTNDGEQTSGTLVLTPTNTEFAILPSSTCTGTTTLAHNASCTVHVALTAASLGTRAGKVQFSATPGNSGEVSLSGTGTAGAALTVSGAGTLTFEMGSVGVVSAEKSITITNSGPRQSGTIAVLSGNPEFALSAPASGDCAGSKLDAGASCLVRVVMPPSAAGPISGTVTVSATPGGKLELAATGSSCPIYQYDNGMGTCVRGDLPLGNVPIPSAGCGKDGVTDLLALGQSVTDGLATSHRLTILSGGKQREYIIDIPADYVSTQPYRLIFSWRQMGGSDTGNATGIHPANDGLNFNATNYAYYGLRREATKANQPSIFVAPETDPAGGLWNYDKDSVYFDDLLALLTTKLCVDESRVFTTGFSYGAMMSYALSTGRAAKLRAAVTMAPAPFGPSPGTAPIAYMSTTGVADTTCKWGTDTSGGKGCVMQHASANGCTVISDFAIAETGSKTYVCYDFQGCKAGYPVKVCTFDGQHTPSSINDGTTIADDGLKAFIPPLAWQFIAQF